MTTRRHSKGGIAVAAVSTALFLASVATYHSITGKSVSKVLIHVSSTPQDDESKAALSFLIGKFAIAKGYQVDIFLAGDAVYLLQDTTLSTLVGKGTGVLLDSYNAVTAGGGRFYVSGMSCKARGITPEELSTKNPGKTPVTFEMPSKLIDLAADADIMFSY